MNFRSPSSKVATFQFQSRARSALPQLQLTSRELRTRGPVGLMSGNWRGGPSTFAKLSRILRQTFAKIRLEVALNLPRQLQSSQKLVSAGWGLLLQRRILAAQVAHSPINISLRAFCAHCQKIHMVHHSSFLLASHTKLSRKNSNNFRDPLRGTFAKVNAKTKRSSPSYLNTRTFRTTLI